MEKVQSPQLQLRDDERLEKDWQFKALKNRLHSPILYVKLIFLNKNEKAFVIFLTTIDLNIKRYCQFKTYKNLPHKQISF